MSAPWPALGIEQTDDRIAIRRAYARRLKAIDVEAHPGAFIALREALGNAMAWAAEQQWRTEQGLPLLDQWPEGPVADPAIDPAAAVPPAEAAPESLDESDATASEAAAIEPAWVPPLPDDGNERFRRLDHLLFGLDGVDPDREALLAATRDIVALLDEESIDRAARIEIWLAESVLTALPRSAPMLDMLVAHFGWDQLAGRIDQPWVFDEVVRRMHAWKFAETVSRPGHRLYPAWKELTDTGPGLGPIAFLRRDNVFHLLHAVRDHNPWAEALLQPHRVALWERKFANGGVSTGFRFLWAFLAMALILGLARFALPTPPRLAPPSAPNVTVSSDARSLADPATDLARAVDEAEGGSLDIRAIEMRNAALYQLLATIWTDTSYAGGNYEDFARDVDATLDQAHAEGLRAANGALLEQHWQLVRDRLLHLRDRPDDCAAFLMGAQRGYDFPPDIVRRGAALRTTLILQAPATPALGSPDPRVDIPGALFEAARARAEMGEAAMRAALAGRGPNAARCPARIALIETALGSSEGREFLREVVAAG